MRILIVSDAWAPQVNGVVTSLQALVSELRAMGHLVKLLSPQDFGYLPCPSYPEIPLAWDLWRVGPAIRDFRPDCVHLATEGPLGWSAVAAARKLGIPVTSGFHTNFDHYSVHYGLGWMRPAVAAYLRMLHRRTCATMVPTEALAAELAGAGIPGVRVVGRGVDTGQF